MQSNARLPLKEKANLIRLNLNRALRHITIAGLELRTVRNYLPYPKFEAWVKKELNISPSTANRYIRLAVMLSDYDAIGIDASMTALYELSSRDDKVKKEAIKYALDGNKLTKAVIEGIVNSVTNEATKEIRLENASDALKSMVEKYSVQAIAIPALMRLEQQNIELFNELSLSGCISIPDRIPVHLSDCTGNDIDNCARYYHYQEKMTRQEKLASDFSDLSNLPTSGLRAIWCSKTSLDDIVASGGKPVMVLVAFGDPQIKFHGNQKLEVSKLKDYPDWFGKLPRLIT